MGLVKRISRGLYEALDRLYNFTGGGN